MPNLFPRKPFVLFDVSSGLAWSVGICRNRGAFSLYTLLFREQSGTVTKWEIGQSLRLAAVLVEID